MNEKTKTLTYPNEELSNTKVGDFKPICKLIGENGNVFNLMGLVEKSLVKSGQGHLVKEMMEKATSGDYDNALRTFSEYVDII